MPKTIFIINSDIYVRHYLQTDALKDIEDESFYFLATDDVTLHDELNAKPNFLGFFKYDPAVFEENLHISQILMLRHQDRCKTFGWRARRQMDQIMQPLQTEAISQTRTYQKLLGKFKYIMPQKSAAKVSLGITRTLKVLKMPDYNKKKLSVFIWGRPGLSSIAKSIFEKQTPPNSDLEMILDREKPDVVIFPSHAIDPLGNDLVRLQKKFKHQNKHGFKTFYLIDNWDNLSSKSVFLYNPDYLGVWGEQSREHAEQIHDISPQKVFLLGTPRVEDYYVTLEKILQDGVKPESPFPFRYLLYVGCSIPFDEISSLRLLEPILDEINKANLDNPLKLVYRPHPWRNKRNCLDLFDPEEFKHIVIDEQVKDFYYHGTQYNRHNKGSYQPSLEYYPRLLANAEMVTGPLTTMLVESALLRKKVLALAYDDGIHVTSPHNALKYYRHFEGLTDIPGIEFIYEAKQYDDSLKAMLAMPDNEVNWQEQAQRIQYYLYRDELAYRSRLKNALLAIVK